jgi:hypothetical protein
VPSAPAAPGAPGHRTEPVAPGAPVAPVVSASARSDLPASFGETSPKRPQGCEGGPGTALRRFRLPVPARVQMHDGRPVRIMVDRHGVAGGAVEQSAGPWRTSGEWWKDSPLAPHSTHLAPVTHPTQPVDQTWDRDEWDVLLNGGAAYRIYVERTVGQWFIEGALD